MYEEGKGVKTDPDEAARWYGIAEESGDASGALSIGEMYEHGLGVPASMQDARKWHGKACGMGDSEGCEKLKGISGR